MTFRGGGKRAKVPTISKELNIGEIRQDILMKGMTLRHLHGCPMTEKLLLRIDDLIERACTHKETGIQMCLNELSLECLVTLQEASTHTTNIEQRYSLIARQFFVDVYNDLERLAAMTKLMEELIQICIRYVLGCVFMGPPFEWRRLDKLMTKTIISMSKKAGAEAAEDDV